MSNDAQSQTQAAYPPVVLMVLLAHPMALTRNTLENYLGVNQPNARTRLQAGEDNAYIVERDGMVFSVMQVDQPIPKPTFETALRTSYGLEKGEALVESHQAHLIVSPLSPSDDPGKTIGLSVTAMQLAASIVRHGEPLGYFWSNAEILADTSQFVGHLNAINDAFALSAKQDPNAGSHLPAIFWVGLRLFSPDQKTLFGAITKGLIAFTGYELEITPLRWPPQQIAQRIYGTMAYLFSNGPVLQDGQTLGVSENEHFVIKRAPATATLPPRLVLTLSNKTSQ